MARELSNWCTGCIPHRDIREDRVSEALFAVNLSRAIAREGADEYCDPTRFFERTHLTRTLQGLIRDVLDTLGGQPGANSVRRGRPAGPRRRAAGGAGPVSTRGGRLRG